MQRTVIEIDEDICNGCGQCVEACHEGAIQMVDGKARLVSDVYCDGLGDCIGECPVGAITKVVREAAAYDQQAVDRRLAELHLAGKGPAKRLGGGCPGSAVRTLPPTPVAGDDRLPCGCPGSAMQALRAPTPAEPAAAPSACDTGSPASRLGQWPVQLRLVPPHAPFLQGADLVVCADCVPFAVSDFHERYLRDRVVVVACPKLDPAQANAERLDAILAQADIRSLVVLRMEVPCCAGIAQQAVQAWKRHKPSIPCEVHVIGIRNGIERQTMVAV